jgi:hypothetical protein
LISRVLTPLNLNKTFSRGEQRIRRFAQKFARYSHINVNEKLYATNTTSSRNSSVPPKIKTKTSEIRTITLRRSPFRIFQIRISSALRTCHSPSHRQPPTVHVFSPFLYAPDRSLNRL